MSNPYIILALVAAVLAGGWRYGEMRYEAGANAVKVAQAAAEAAQGAKEAEGVREIIKWKEKRVIVYRDRIKEIKVAADPTGCLDTNLAELGLGGMLRSGGDSTGPGAGDAAGDVPAD